MTRRTVLVVEDDDDLRRGLALRVRSFGYDVIQAEDGLFAVTQATKARPDVVLLDLGLPGGDGVSVLRRYSGIPALAGTPVVVLTGRDPVAAEADVRPYNVTALLSKPADNAELAQALAAAALGGRPMGPDGGRAVSKGKVLLVEDDDDLRRGMVLRLRSLGYEAVEASDGYSAVSVAVRERPDAVVLDLGLPGGDGVSVLDRYARISCLTVIPVVVLTGRDREAAETAVRPFRVSAVITKPADNATLAAALESAVGASAMPPPSP